MTTETILLTAFIPAEPARVYRAWLSSEVTQAFTGSPAEIEGRVGGRYRAWDGYVSAVNRSLAEGRRILQAWRASDFPAEAADSVLELHFDPEESGTHLTLLHADVPEGRGKDLEQGWLDKYIEPLKRYFGAQASPPAAAPRRAPKKAAGKAARKRRGRGRSAGRGSEPARSRADASGRRRAATSKRAASPGKKAAATAPGKPPAAGKHRGRGRARTRR